MKEQKNNRIPQFGDIYMMNFSGTGSEQKGYRPGVVFQNNKGNTHSPNLIVLPLTRQIKKTNQPTHVFLPKSIGIHDDSMVLCENPERMSKEKLGKYIATIPTEYMAQIAIASTLATSAIACLSQETLLAIWRKALALNAVATA